MIERLVTTDPHTVDVPRKHRPMTFWKDWDRALGRVEPSLGRLWAVAEPHGVDVRRIQAEYAESKRLRLVSKDGGSYEPVSAVESEIVAIAGRQRAAGDPDPITMAKIAAEYVAYQPKDPSESLIYPDTPGLVHRVTHAGVPNFVKTYGVSEIWQRDFKVAAGGYPGYVESLTHTNKAAEQESYRNPETGTFDCYEVTNGNVTAVITAKEVAGVDDKVPSLVGGPDDFTGYLLRRPDEPVQEAQKGDWPAELTIHSLGQLVVEDGKVIRLDEPVPDYPTVMPVSDVLYVPINYSQIQ